MRKTLYNIFMEQVHPLAHACGLRATMQLRKIFAPPLPHAVNVIVNVNSRFI